MSIEQFYFVDSHGDEAFVKESDYKRALTRMRSACVEKVRAMRDEWRNKHANASSLEAWRHFGTLITFYSGAEVVAEKIVKVCDRCGAESILFNTSQWATVTFHRLKLGNPDGDQVKYDLCGTCAPQVQVYAFGGEAKPLQEQEVK